MSLAPVSRRINRVAKSPIGKVGLAAASAAVESAVTGGMDPGIGTSISITVAEYAVENMVKVVFSHNPKIRGVYEDFALETSWEETKQIKCKHIFLCKYALPGIAGMFAPSASHHFILLFTNEAKTKTEVGFFRESKYLACKAFSFEFGLAAAARAGAGIVTVGKYEFKLDPSSWDDVNQMSDDLKNNSINVKNYATVKCSLQKAVQIALELGKKEYTLESFNCKAFAKSLFDSIRLGTITLHSDEGRATIQKYLAKSLVVSRAPAEDFGCIEGYHDDDIDHVDEEAKYQPNYYDVDLSDKRQLSMCKQYLPLLDLELLDIESLEQFQVVGVSWYKDSWEHLYFRLQRYIDGECFYRECREVITLLENGTLIIIE